FSASSGTRATAPSVQIAAPVRKRRNSKSGLIQGTRRAGRARKNSRWTRLPRLSIAPASAPARATVVAALTGAPGYSKKIGSYRLAPPTRLVSTGSPRISTPTSPPVSSRCEVRWRVTGGSVFAVSCGCSPGESASAGSARLALLRIRTGASRPHTGNSTTRSYMGAVGPRGLSAAAPRPSHSRHWRHRCGRSHRQEHVAHAGRHHGQGDAHAEVDLAAQYEAASLHQCGPYTSAPH